MKYLKKWYNISEASPKKRMYPLGTPTVEKEEMETIRDIFQDVIDERYDFNIRPNQRHIEKDIVYGVQYDISIKGISNEFSDEMYYNKNHDISKMIISNIERLEKIGYEIVYRSITNTLSNSITSLECKIQFWSRKPKASI